MLRLEFLLNLASVSDVSPMFGNNLGAVNHAVRSLGEPVIVKKMMVLLLLRNAALIIRLLKSAENFCF